MRLTLTLAGSGLLFFAAQILAADPDNETAADSQLVVKAFQFFDAKGKPGIYSGAHRPNNGKCAGLEQHCESKIDTAKLVLDYAPMRTLKVQVIPVAGVLTMLDGSRQPTSGACVHDGAPLVCELLLHNSTMELRIGESDKAAVTVFYPERAAVSPRNNITGTAKLIK